MPWEIKLFIGMPMMKIIKPIIAIFVTFYMVIFDL
jgi:hypothetical protein